MQFVGTNRHHILDDLPRSRVAEVILTDMNKTPIREFGPLVDPDQIEAVARQHGAGSYRIIGRDSTGTLLPGYRILRIASDAAIPSAGPADARPDPLMAIVTQMQERLDARESAIEAAKADVDEKRIELGKGNLDLATTLIDRFTEMQETMITAQREADQAARDREDKAQQSEMTNLTTMFTSMMEVQRQQFESMLQQQRNELEATQHGPDASGLELLAQLDPDTLSEIIRKKLGLEPTDNGKGANWIEDVRGIIEAVRELAGTEGGAVKNLSFGPTIKPSDLDRKGSTQ